MYETSASLSLCGKYRYSLGRRWDRALPMLVFIMLNPSTADARVDDATIRRCVAFAKRDNYGAVLVHNLFALRATKPKALWLSPDPIGPDNDLHLSKLAGWAGTIVCAWGVQQHPKFMERARHVVHNLRASPAVERLHCLGTTKEGHPRHPLYLSKETEIEEWNGGK